MYQLPSTLRQDYWSKTAKVDVQSHQEPFQPVPPLHAEVHVCLWRLPHTTKAVIVPIFNLQKGTSANAGPKSKAKSAK